MSTPNGRPESAPAGMIVSRLIPACQATVGDDERDKELKPAERKDGRGRAEVREGRRRCSGSMSGHRVWVAAC